MATCRPTAVHQFPHDHEYNSWQAGLLTLQECPSPDSSLHATFSAVNVWIGEPGMMKYLGPCLLAALASACSGNDAVVLTRAPSGAGDELANAPTFYEDVAPVFGAKCVGCHQEGGIAPFSLYDYTAAHDRAAQIAAYTADRIMPPFLIETGGECGSFDESATLTQQEIDLIGTWASTGASEGTPVELQAPPVPALESGTDFSIPEFVPRIAGGALAQFDEYRCFTVPTGLTADKFVTGYDVLPDNAALVHHVLAFVIDPNRVTETGQTNTQVMDRLHAADADPTRPGWSCFGLAGEGVEIESVPVIWAPGEGVVQYPSGMGVPLKSDRTLVVQVHYNMADGAVVAPDHTKVRLQLSDTVERLGVFLFDDSLLNTLGDAQPVVLQPGQPSVKFSWEQQGRQLGIPEGLPTEIVALWPHMHGRGKKYTFEVGTNGNYACEGRVNRWDFNWQRVYNYSTPLPFTADSSIRVTCDYDTSADTQPVLPGWGTRNEMCFMMMMVTLPVGFGL
jgi:hypothetical protein